MEQLPYDVLARIAGYLDTKSLLQLKATSRLLDEKLSDPLLWRHLDVEVQSTRQLEQALDSLVTPDSCSLILTVAPPETEQKWEWYCPFSQIFSKHNSEILRRQGANVRRLVIGGKKKHQHNIHCSTDDFCDVVPESVELLTLVGFNLSHDITWSAPNTQSVRELTLDDCSLCFTRVIWRKMSGLPNLRKLSLRRSDFSWVGIRNLPDDLPQLSHLDLSETSFDSKSDTLRILLTEMPNLRHLVLNSCRLGLGENIEIPEGAPIFITYLEAKDTVLKYEHFRNTTCTIVI